MNYIEFPNIGLELPLGRVAFNVFGIDIYWYGVVICTAIILGFLYAIIRSRQFGMISDKVFDTAVVGLIGGFIGARTYYVIFSEIDYTFLQVITDIRLGGLAIYGGITGAVVFALVYMKLRKVRILPVLDLAGLGFLIGIGLGRWGNFFNQEAYGAAVAGGLPWGMTGDRIARELGTSELLVHPCFLYESLWCLLGFALLHFYSKKLRSFDGEIALLFVTWYGLGRMFNEQLRTDSLMLADFKVSQILAALSAGAALGIFIYFKRRKTNVLYGATEESVNSFAAYEEKLKLDKEKAAAKKALKEKEAPSILGDTEDNDNGENT